MEKNKASWGVAEVWNRSLSSKPERETKTRDYLWASELGKAPVDLYLRLKGTPPSNPPDDRAKRKFEGGNIWEWVLQLVFQRAGILVSNQEHLAYQYEGLLKVTGRLDFIAGGKPNYETAVVELEALKLPEVFTRACKDIIDYLKATYPEGLEETIVEFKSLSAFMFNGLERTRKASKNHRMQMFHYLKSTSKPRGLIVYMCRDDCRMMEIPVFNEAETEAEYRSHIANISVYVQQNEQPPLEKPIVFDEDLLKFSKNWKMGYSDYLELLYGIKSQGDFDDMYVPIASRFNRVINRMKLGKKMTDKNNAALEEIKVMGFDIDYIISKFPAEPEEEENGNGNS